MGQLDRIDQQPEFMGGKASIRGMRVTVGMVVDQMGEVYNIPIQLEDTGFVSSSSNTKPGGFLRGKRLISALNSNRNTACHPNTSHDFLRDNALTETSVLKGERYIDEILADYPYLEREDAMQALRYFATHQTF